MLATAYTLSCLCDLLPCCQIASEQHFIHLWQIAIRAVESEQTKLDQVLKLLGYLHQHFSQVADPQVREVMLNGLEMRFAAYDQPVLLMAYLLNPQRRNNFLNTECRFASWRNAMKLVEVLWERLFPDTPEPHTSIVDQFLSYWNKEDPFDEGKSCHTDGL